MDKKIKERLAQVFVDKYIKEGVVAAGLHAHRTIPKEHEQEMIPIIRSAFRSKGYVFPSDKNRNGDGLA